MESNADNTLIDSLKNSTRILALIGAGLSRPSGLPTFRHEGSIWRGKPVSSMATRSAFAEDPGLVWQFYESRRQMALRALPNRGHKALAELARAKPEFLAITQNIDGLSERAGHLASNLAVLHGTLFTVTCFDPECTYSRSNHEMHPIVPQLALPPWDITDPESILPPVAIEDLPHCPKCTTGLLRPGVVLFGDKLPTDCLDRIDAWFDDSSDIELMLVVGTSGRVFPAAEFIHRAAQKGAQIAVFNVEVETDELEEGDWSVLGDASVSLPNLIGQALGIEI
ncbi:Hypothetical protein R9X50_00681800 [Acrodontium crateriforme]|uniref:Deacetylase sirtuin-type domain-containing protein n=1 Tax=Acrodontium crateriforme TaxID=150365 RepID=A0AAQ3MAD5_9PEZI|nr:Hypothetical protein R9X50_00681800 [Acrodontium crateriforme]